MAISFVAAGTEASGTSGTTVTPALPAGIVNDDILILPAACWDGNAVGSMGAGWTRIAEISGSTSYPSMAVFWNRYDGTDPSRVVTFSGSSGDQKIAAIFAVRGCKTSGDPYNKISAEGTGVDNTIEHSSVTTDVDGCMLICLNATDGNNARTSLASGFTNIFEDTSGGTQNAYTSTDASIHASYKDQGTQGATGTLVVSGSSLPGWTSFLIALEPAGSGAQTLTPSLFTNTNTFYAPTVSRGARTLTPSLFTNTNTFPAAVVRSVYTLTPAKYTDADSFFAPTVSRGAATLAPSLFTNVNAFYAANVGRGPVTLSPSLFTDADSFFAPTVSTRTTLSPSLYNDPDSFFSPTVSRGPVTLTPSLFSNSNTFYSPTVTNGSATLTPAFFADADVFYSPSVGRGSVTLSPSLLSDADSFFAPTVGRGAVTLQPSLFSNSNTFFSPVVSSVHELLPSLFENSNIFYSPTVTSVGASELLPSFFENQNTFFPATVRFRGWVEKTKQAETWTVKTQQAEAWTAKTGQSESWSAQSPNEVGVGFSQGFASRPAFQIAFRNGIWADSAEQSETWTAV
jgi:hypothetical protein